MNPYGDVIVEHSRHPRNYGSLEAPEIRHEEVNPLCGDRVRIELAVAPDGTIRQARFQGDLCVIAKASSSLLMEMITGSTLDLVSELPDQQLLDALRAKLPPSRLPCALLPLGVARTGVNAYRQSDQRH